MNLLLWGTGGPVMYAAIVSALLALVFIVGVRNWLRNNPVLPLNWEYEPKYRRSYPTAPQTNDWQTFATSPIYAASATYLMPIMQIEHRRAHEKALWR